MNKEFTRISEEEAIISDDEGRLSLGKYYDNLSEELVGENKIEVLEKELIKLDNEEKDFEKNRHKNYDKIIKATTMIGIISGLLLILTFLESNSISNLLAAYIKNFDMTNLLIMESLATSTSVIFTGLACKSKQEDLKYTQELNVKIENVRKSLITEKQSLAKELEKCPSRTEFIGLETRAIPSFSVEELLDSNTLLTSTKDKKDEQGPKLVKTRNPKN